MCKSEPPTLLNFDGGCARTGAVSRGSLVCVHYILFRSFRLPLCVYARLARVDGKPLWSTNYLTGSRDERRKKGWCVWLADRHLIVMVCKCRIRRLRFV